MPEISRFHFHAQYGDDVALIDINALSVFSGHLPPRALGLVIEWATLHHEALTVDWERARAKQELIKIPPLE